ncbi:MAG: hypothetical protein AAFP04_11045 [Myxococcota bacterium]
MKVRIAFVLSITVLMLGVLAVLTRGSERGELSPETLQATSAPAPSASLTTDTAGDAAGHNSEFDRALIAHLRARYGEGIEHSTIQMKMLEAMMRHFQVLRPNDWRAPLEALVREAFPAQADAILALLRDRLEYQNWIDENQELLGRLDATERESLLREAGRESRPPAREMPHEQAPRAGLANRLDEAPESAASSLPASSFEWCCVRFPRRTWRADARSEPGQTRSCDLPRRPQYRSLGRPTERGRSSPEASPVRARLAHCLGSEPQGHQALGQ